MEQKKNWTILLVEDEPIVSMVNQKELEQKGYNVYPVQSGEQAIAVMYTKEIPIDLILMDIDLGKGIDGTEAARQILTQEDIPIVFLSSHTEPEIVEKTEKITSYGYVVKRSGIVVLDASIKMALKLFNAKTERAKAEKALRESEEKLRRLVQNLHAGVVVHGPDTQILLSNQRASVLLGLTVDQMTGKTAIDPSWHFLREDASLMPHEEFPVSRVLQTKQPIKDMVVGINRLDTNDRVWVQISAFPEFDENDDLLQIVVTFVDITERMQMEQELQSSTDLITKLINFTPVGISLTTIKEATYIKVNREFAQLFESTAEEMIGKTAFDCGIWKNSEERYRFIQRLEQNGSIRNMKVMLQTTTGKEIPVLISTEKITIQNQPCMLASVQDISEINRAELEIKRQLSEKELLLKEVHHRVKNNIANIEGLLMLQLESSANTEVKLNLAEAISRVQSLRMLYEKLIFSKDYHIISIKPYLNDLIEAIKASFPESRFFGIHSSIAEMNVTTSHATSIGIIVNELLTNVFKYAFVGGNEGLVKITLNRHDNYIQLVVHDNGVGMPISNEKPKPTGFGMMLIQMLVEQLNGIFTIENDHGTKATIQLEI